MGAEHSGDPRGEGRRVGPGSCGNRDLRIPSRQVEQFLCRRQDEGGDVVAGESLSRVLADDADDGELARRAGGSDLDPLAGRPVLGRERRVVDHHLARRRREVAASEGKPPQAARVGDARPRPRRSARGSAPPS